MSASERQQEKIRQQAEHDLLQALDEANWPDHSREEARKRLLAWLDDPLSALEFLEVFPDLIIDLAATPDPSMALINWDRYGQAVFSRSAFLHLLKSNPDFRRFLLKLFAASQFLSDIVVRNPEYLDWVFGDGQLGREKRLDDFRSELEGFVRPFKSSEARRRALCRFKRRELLRIGVRDLRGIGTTEEHCRELSRLAQAACELALSDSVPPLIERFGRPSPPPGKPYPGSPGFCVVAMGKFGGEELNFSSDIDLVFVYDAEGNTEGRADTTGHRSSIVTNNEFYAKLSNAFTTYLSDHTTEGMLYRVDTRLRPDGASGAIARSVSSYVAYFAEQARSWEKISYLKARAVAGDRNVAERFREVVTSFVYTQNDPAILLPEIARLKRRIDYESLDAKGRRLDIKRGTGGIREIEFFVAALQLLYGVSEKNLRAGATLTALHRLVEIGQVEESTAQELEETYWFFRRVEHMLQMMEEKQTHALPAEESHRAALAKRCGFPSLEEFEAQLARRREFVRKRFEELFHDERSAGEFNLADHLISDSTPSEEVLERLRPHGLGSVEGFNALRELAVGTCEVAIRSAGQRRFEQFLPDYLEQLNFAPMPILAVRHLSHLMRSHHCVSMLYELIATHRPLARLFARALGYGHMPARLLTGHPEWLDEVFEATALSPGRRPRAIFEERLAGWIFDLDIEKALTQLRRFKDVESLFIILREIVGVLGSREAARLTTELAEVCLQTVAELAHPRWSTSDTWCVLVYGSFGAEQVHVCSDLDVAFFFDAGMAEEGENDAHRLERIASFILSQMTAVTPDGQIWKMDARLRPDGRNAPLAVSLERAKDYYCREAGIWEMQSATRARFGAGNREVGERVVGILQESLAERSGNPHLGAEILDMRRRMEGTLKLPRRAAFDLKLSSGGLVDVEFLIQFFKIENAASRPELMDTHPDKALESIREAGLLGDSDADFLLDHYATLRTIQRAIRLLWETAKDHFPAEEERRAMLCRALSAQLPEAERIFRELPARMKKTRCLLLRVLG